ncbi:hypothetical protein BV20DRAFT_415741 [Pilatotrama ljubarskyi]|nr:hypothetical protein BV20DRAFT_415741 [Pilatotrama ljubarskyi]
MAPMISILATNLATVCVESAFWGIFFVLAMTSIILFVQRSRNREGPSYSSTKLWRSPLFIASCLLLGTVTAHWIVLVRRLFIAFIDFEGGTQPIVFFASLREPTEVVLTALNVVSVVICDLMMIARTWVIWNKSIRVVIFPILTTIGLTVCSITITYLFSQYDSGEDLYQSTLGHWVTAGYVLTISTNVYGTGMISYRILSTSKALKHGIRASGGRSIMEALSIFIESAALYAVWGLFFFVTYQAKLSINVLANDCLPAVSGISLMLITLRISLGWAHRAPSSANASGAVPSIGGGSPGVVLSRGGRPSDGYPLRTIALNVTRTVEQQADYAIGSPHDKGKDSDGLSMVEDGSLNSRA